MEDAVAHLNELHRAMLQDEEYIMLEAQLLRRRYEKLMEVGFTEQEALYIVATQGTGTKIK